MNPEVGGRATREPARDNLVTLREDHLVWERVVSVNPIAVVHQEASVQPRAQAPGYADGLGEPLRPNSVIIGTREREPVLISRIHLVVEVAVWPYRKSRE
jgi:hypothetical protein